MIETEVEENPRDILVKNFVIQLGKRIDKVNVVINNDHFRVYPNGWLEKQTWRETNDILRLNGFCWFPDGRCWIKELTRFEMRHFKAEWI